MSLTSFDRALGLPELDTLAELVDRLGDTARVREIGRVRAHGRELPIHGIVVGATDRTRPTLAVIAGMHGLERIGTRVVLAWLTTLSHLLQWDVLLQRALADTRLVLVPLVNPGGMFGRTRANARGVDLMRNAPPHPHAVGSFLVGGHRLSPRLPWYMGAAGAPIEPELEALAGFVEHEVFAARPAILLDVHSGYGTVDRLWFPWARTRKPFPRLAEMLALAALLNRTLPDHVYRIEPQARAYTIVGDVWDWLFDRHAATWPGGVFLPLTLEMGSWLWVRKNPRQLLDVLGAFNPLEPHRARRILRRHIALLDFLHRACAAPRAWIPATADERTRLERAAFARWYGS